MDAAAPPHDARCVALGEQCAVCLEPMALPALCGDCLHAFCLDCIRFWATRSRSCPLCKRPFSYVLTHVMSAGAFNVVPIGDPDAGVATVPMPTLDVAHIRRLHVHYTRARLLGAGDPPPALSAVEVARPHVRARLEAWVARELRAVLRTDDVVIVSALVLHELSRRGIDAADAALIDALGRHLAAAGDPAIFARDCAAFLCSGLSIAAFDAAARYESTLPPRTASVAPAAIPDPAHPAAPAAAAARKRRRGDCDSERPASSTSSSDASDDEGSLPAAGAPAAAGASMSADAPRGQLGLVREEAAARHAAVRRIEQLDSELESALADLMRSCV